MTGAPSKSPIQLAAAGGHLEVMEEMSKYNILQEICEYDCIIIFRYITSQDWKRRDDWGWTLLHEVAHNGRPEVT